MRVQEREAFTEDKRLELRKQRETDANKFAVNEVVVTVDVK